MRKAAALMSDLHKKFFKKLFYLCIYFLGQMC